MEQSIERKTDPKVARQQGPTPGTMRTIRSRTGPSRGLREAACRKPRFGCDGIHHARPEEAPWQPTVTGGLRRYSVRQISKQPIAYIS